MERPRWRGRVTSKVGAGLEGGGGLEVYGLAAAVLVRSRELEHLEVVGDLPHGGEVVAVGGYVGGVVVVETADEAGEQAAGALHLVLYFLGNECGFFIGLFPFDGGNGSRAQGQGVGAQRGECFRGCRGRQEGKEDEDCNV